MEGVYSLQRKPGDSEAPVGYDCDRAKEIMNWHRYLVDSPFRKGLLSVYILIRSFVHYDIRQIRLVCLESKTVSVA